MKCWAMKNIGMKCSCKECPGKQVCEIFKESETLKDNITERMKSIILQDKTKQYEYGEVNSFQEKPPLGECWLTPSEIAKSIIIKIRK